MSPWEPATATEVEKILETQLKQVSQIQRDYFDAHRCTFFSTPIERYGLTESVWCIARFGSQVLYYEDVEEGFMLSGLDDRGYIAVPDFNQFEIGHVLNQLLNARGRLDG